MPTATWLFGLVAEADSSVTALAIRKEKGKLVTVKKSLVLEGGLQVCSCSLARPKNSTSATVNAPYKFVAAICTWDKC